MTQPHGRYQGSRDKGPRQSRQASKTTSRRPNKPYVKAPARDSAQTASIFKTRSFKWLVDAVGAENIALGLDSNLTRVNELINGERFTPETAFHIETTLGLPEGFFDQPNPALTPETITRVKAPLEFIGGNAEQESMDGEALDPALTIPANHRTGPIDPLPRESKMSKRTAGGTPQTVAKSKRAAAKTAPVPSSKSASPKAKTPAVSEVQQSLPLNDIAALQNIRRANLHILTSRKGSKVRLSAVIGISASNLDNRLYGQKRMDDAEAHRFTEHLKLPIDWLDVPRTVTDIPEQVTALLDPQSDRATPNQREPRAAVVPKAAVARKSAGRRAKNANDRHAQASAADVTGARALTEPFVERQDSSPPQVPDLAIRQPVDDDVILAPFYPPATTSPVTEAVAESRRSAPVTSLDDLAGIAPIAEALIKTLAGKARTGRLDEVKALELLRQIVSL